MKLVGGDGRELSWKFVAEGSTDSQHWFTYVALIRVGDKPLSMMTSSNGNIFRVTGPLCGEFTGHR